jgi:hypothetical protein
MDLKARGRCHDVVQDVVVRHVAEEALVSRIPAGKAYRSASRVLFGIASRRDNTILIVMQDHGPTGYIW